MTTMPPAPTLRVVGAVFTRERAESGELEVLAFRRASHKDAGGLWEFAGGKIEPGETPEDALAREITEELGITVSVGELVRTSEIWVAERSRHVTLSCFFVTAIGDLPTQSTDHDEMRWMLVSELHVLNWIAPDVPIVEALQNRTR